MSQSPHGESVGGTKPARTPSLLWLGSGWDSYWSSSCLFAPWVSAGAARARMHIGRGTHMCLHTHTYTWVPIRTWTHTHPPTTCSHAHALTHTQPSPPAPLFVGACLTECLLFLEAEVEDRPPSLLVSTYVLRLVSGPRAHGFGLG